MLRLLAVALALSFAGAAGAQGLTVFHDPTNTGTQPTGPGAIAINAGTTPINLYYTAGPNDPVLGQECTGGTGQEVCGLDFLILATGGVTIVPGSFVPGTNLPNHNWVVNDTSTAQIAGNGGNAITGAGNNGADKVGTFLVLASGPGTLDLTGKNWVNSSLALLNTTPTVLAIAGAADFDGDGTADASDSCPTLANTVDADADGVNDACDTCVGLANAVFGGSMTNRTRVSGQLDDDGDGLGNRCDFNYNNAGLTIDSTDFNHAKASFGKGVSLSTCGLAPANNQRCGEFDHSGGGLSIDATDFNLAKAAFGKAAGQPKCAACTPPFSNTLAVGATVGRVVCEGVACTY